MWECIRETTKNPRKSSAILFTTGEVSTPSGLRPASKVWGNLLPIYFCSGRTEFHDFWETEAAWSISRIATAWQSSKPHSMLQLRFGLNKRLDESTGASSLTIATDVGHPGRLIVNVVHHLWAGVCLTPQECSDKHWENFKFVDGILWPGKQIAHYVRWYLFTRVRETQTLTCRVEQNASNWSRYARAENPKYDLKNQHLQHCTLQAPFCTRQQAQKDLPVHVANYIWLISCLTHTPWEWNRQRKLDFRSNQFRR